MVLFLLGCVVPKSVESGGGGVDESGGADSAGFLCQLPTMDDAANDCGECIDEKCADLLEFCRESDECACMEACLREDGMPGIEACLTSNGLDGRPVGFAQLEECVAYSCPDDDECSTPADWTPPDAEIECDGTGTGGLGGGAEADCGFDDAIAYDPEGEVLQLVSSGGDICVRIDRHVVGGGELENVEWALDAIRIGPFGEVSEVTDPDALCWYSSHHNFQDWAHIWSGSRHYDLGLKEDGHGGARRYHLYVFEEGPLQAGECGPTSYGTACVEGPIALAPYTP
jgi:hypothetical protein